MASGNSITALFPQGNIPPSTNFATLDTFAAATGIRLVLDFIGSGGSVDETAIFEFDMPSQYAGGGLAFLIYYST